MLLQYRALRVHPHTRRDCIVIRLLTVVKPYDILRMEPFRAILKFKLDRLTCLKGLESLVIGDGRIVDKDIAAIVGVLHEAGDLLGVQPLYHPISGTQCVPPRLCSTASGS